MTTTTETDPRASLAAMRILSADVGALLDTFVPDDWQAGTPCPDLDVLGVVVHLATGLRTFTRLARWGAVRALAVEEVEPAEPARAYRDAAAEAAEVWSAPGRLETAYPMPWGHSTGAKLVDLLVLEQAAHGWDLARGVGRPDGFTPAAAAVELADGVARAVVTDALRIPGMFAPEVPASADASPLDRLAAFLGRRP